MTEHRSHLHDADTRPQPLIELRHVSVNYDRPVLTDIDFTVYRGDFVAITGPNGGGKTTLLRTMLRLLKPTSGEVVYFDPEGREAKRLSIGYLPQKSDIDTRFPITVEEVILSGLYRGIFPRVTAEDRRRLEAILKETDAESFRHRSVGELSGGQLQRALLGRALISDPEVLVLDEPLSYVDKNFERRIYTLMERLASRTTIILVSHEMSVIAGMANRHLIVDHSLQVCHSGKHFPGMPCETTPESGCGCGCDCR